MTSDEIEELRDVVREFIRKKCLENLLDHTSDVRNKLNDERIVTDAMAGILKDTLEQIPCNCGPVCDGDCLRVDIENVLVRYEDVKQDRRN